VASPHEQHFVVHVDLPHNTMKHSDRP